MVREVGNKLEDIPKSKLDSILQRFFAEVRKQDGGEYEPESLHTMLASLDRFLREKGRVFSIQKDREFEGCRKVLNGRAIVLRGNGMGKKKKGGSIERTRRGTAVAEESIGSFQPKEPQLYHLFHAEPAVRHEGLSGAPSASSGGPQVRS